MKTTLARQAGIITGILLCASRTGAALVAIHHPLSMPADVSVGAQDGGADPFKHELRLFMRPVAYDGSSLDSASHTWLGVGVEESSKPLTAQLGLKPGQGLVVNFIATNSPAFAAGLREDDVLVELDGQMLMDPAQLRKLVQMHDNGDSIKIGFYRAGTKQSVSAKLSTKTFDRDSTDAAIQPDARFWYHAAPGSANQSRTEVNLEVEKAMAQAQRVVQDALRQSQVASDNGQRKLEIIHKKLGSLASGGVNLSADATVVVKNENASIRTIVKKDDAGTYVIVADPKKHLTAHDADGKLSFDGEIESAEQQKKVPKEVWAKVEPMLDQLVHDGAPANESPQDEDSKQK